MVNESIVMLVAAGFGAGGFLAGYAKCWFQQRPEICDLRRDLNLCSNSDYVADLRERTKKAEKKADKLEKKNQELANKVFDLEHSSRFSEAFIDKYYEEERGTFDNINQKKKAVQKAILAASDDYEDEDEEGDEDYEEEDEEQDEEQEELLFHFPQQTKDEGKKYAREDGRTKEELQDIVSQAWLLTGCIGKNADVAAIASRKLGEDITENYVSKLLSAAITRLNSTLNFNGIGYCPCYELEDREGTKRIVPQAMVDFERRMWPFAPQFKLKDSTRRNITFKRDKHSPASEV